MSLAKVFDSRNNIIIPDWPAPANVQALVTTRATFLNSNDATITPTGYDYFNLALHVNDCPEKVLSNRQKLADHLEIPPSNVAWLEQIHGTEITSTEALVAEKENTVSLQKAHLADACTSSTRNHPCTIMTADCLPVLFCTVSNNDMKQKVAAAHAGWRGLADGILSKTLSTFSQPETVIAWLGPAISQEHFEVGQEVFDAFVRKDTKNKDAFIPSPNTSRHEPKWLANLYQLAKIELRQSGIKAIYGGEYCTYRQEQLFYSYRRDGAQSGRMASLIAMT